MLSIAPGWQTSPLAVLAMAAAFAFLLVLRSRGRVDRAWAALLAPGAWRWGLVAAGLGLAACALLAAGALPALLGADCQAATGAQGLLRAATALGIGFAAGGVLCLAARGMLAAVTEGVRGAAWPAAGRVVGLGGLACLAFSGALAVSGLSALARDGDGQVLRTAWAAQARETCRVTEASSVPVPAPVVQAPAPTPAPVQQAGSPAQERLLAEIRDLLRDQQRRAAQAVTLPPIPPAYVPPRTEPSRAEPRPTVRRPVPTRPAMPFYGYPYEY